MLCRKASWAEVGEPPILFINLLVINKTSGVEKPSPRDPNSPKIINNLSTPSACMKMDLMDPTFIVLLLLLSLLGLFCPIFPPFLSNQTTVKILRPRPDSGYVCFKYINPLVFTIVHYISSEPIGLGFLMHRTFVSEMKLGWIKWTCADGRRSRLTL